MNAKRICILLAAFFIAASVWAQTESEDYWVDENGQFHQILRWHPSQDVGFYDVEIEKRDNEGEWQAVQTSRADYDADSIEVTLPPGTYRFRIHSYNVIGKLAATGDWTPVRVYRAAVPQATPPTAAVEIPKGDADFTVRINGSDLAEGAEVYLVPVKGEPVQIKPLRTNYSFDDTWIEAAFPTDAVPKGKYNLVITNPGGLSQTVEGLEVKIVKARPKEGEKPRTWNLAFSGGFSYMPFIGPMDAALNPHNDPGAINPEYSKVYYPQGAYARLGYYWQREGESFSRGLEFNLVYDSVYSVKEDTPYGKSTLKGALLLLNLDVIYKRWFREKTMSFNFRGGIGLGGTIKDYTIEYENANDQHNYGLGSWNIDLGLSWDWNFWKIMMFEIGVDYFQPILPAFPFDDDPGWFFDDFPFPGYARVYAGLGIRF
jgi:hypothetical protein